VDAATSHNAVKFAFPALPVSVWNKVYGVAKATQIQRNISPVCAYNKNTTRPSITKILILEPIAMVVGIVENVDMVGDKVTGEVEGCEVVGVLEGCEVVGVLDGCAVVGVLDGLVVVGDKDGCGVVGDLEGVSVVGGVGACVAPVYTQRTEPGLLQVTFP
jgi:hypothetical protein